MSPNCQENNTATGDKIMCQNKLGVAGEEGVFLIIRTKGRTYFLRLERIHSIIARLNRRPRGLSSGIWPVRRKLTSKERCYHLESRFQVRNLFHQPPCAPQLPPSSSSFGDHSPADHLQASIASGASWIIHVCTDKFKY